MGNKDRTMFASRLFDLSREDFNLIRFIVIVYIIGFSAGTTTHIMDIVKFGLFGYYWVSLPINVYWTSLTILDPLAVVLMIFKPYWGIVLSVLIMVSDLSVNIYTAIIYYMEKGNLDIFHLSFQIPFGVFIFITAPILWTKIRKAMNKD
jgi:hypothetical protein